MYSQSLRFFRSYRSRTRVDHITNAHDSNRHLKLSRRYVRMQIDVLVSIRSTDRRIP